MPAVTLPLLAIAPSRLGALEAVGGFGVGGAVEVVAVFAERCLGAMMEVGVEGGYGGGEWMEKFVVVI